MFYDAYTDSIIDLCPRARKFHIWIQVQSIWIDCSLPKATWIKSMLHLTDLRSILFFWTSVCIHLHYIWVGKERWMNRKKKSIQVRRIGRGKGIRFPFSFQPYISLSSLLPITAKFSSYFLTNQKTKRKDCFPLFVSLWFLISCHFHPLPCPSSQP